MNIYQVIASLTRPVVYIMMIVVVWLTVRGIRATWRAARRVNVENVARTAGALSSAAQDRAASITRAFKDGRGR